MVFDEKPPARMQSNQALQASAYVGRQVMLALDAGQYVSHPDAAIFIDVLDTTSLIRIFIYSQSGDMVKRLLLTGEHIGLQPLIWSMPAGKYRLVAQGKAVLMVSGNVDSVSLGKEGDGLRLNVAGIGEVGLEHVRL